MINFTVGNFPFSFWGTLQDSQEQSFDVYFDDKLIGKFQPATNVFEYFVSDTFSATAGPHKITIKGTNSKGVDNSGFIGDLKLVYRP